MQNGITILDFLQFETPTQEQKVALLAMAEFVKPENKDDFFILCGAAGTGKTSITTALVGYMNNREIGYQIAAPTGRAARILGRKSKVLSSTIHSMIYNVNCDPKTGEVHFTLKQRDNEEDTPSIFIIDEASMVNAKAYKQEDSLFLSDNSLLNDLVKYVKQHHTNSKIIFLGDRNQLPPVHEQDSYALMPDYLNDKFSWKGNSQILTEVKRQEDGSRIMKNAINTRIAIENNKQFSKLDCFKFNWGIAGATTHYIDNFKKNGPDKSISIGSTHKSNQLFNNIVREKLFGKKCKMLEEGDYLLVTQSWERNGHRLFNGDHVVVEDFDSTKTEMVAGLHFMPIKLKAKNIEGNEEIIEDYILIESISNPSGILPLERERQLRHDRFTINNVYRETKNPRDDRYIGAIRLTYGHSITCNKAQGGEWEEVFVNTYHVPNLKWQYTAITRAQNELLLY
jgi:exodeoxyribonuclease-5